MPFVASTSSTLTTNQACLLHHQVPTRTLMSHIVVLPGWPHPDCVRSRAELMAPSSNKRAQLGEDAGMKTCTREVDT